MKFLTVEEVIEIHTMMIQSYAGLDGIRDMGLLISAVEMPKASMFGEFLHASIYDKASAYLYHIACNHPFLDGNKRTALAASLTFLEMNQIDCELKFNELEEMVVHVAEGILEKAQISLFLQNQPPYNPKEFKPFRPSKEDK